MSVVKEELQYTTDHEWAKIEDGVATIGITDHAQSELGDIVFVELPEVGDEVVKGDSFGTVEAVKTVAELYSPIDGEIVEVNTSLADEAEIINNSPYDEGWIIKVKISGNADDLMSAEEYRNHIG